MVKQHYKTVSPGLGCATEDPVLLNQRFLWERLFKTVKDLRDINERCGMSIRSIK